MFIRKDVWFIYKIASLSNDCTELNTFLFEFIIVSKNFPKRNISKEIVRKKDFPFMIHLYGYFFPTKQAIIEYLQNMKNLTLVRLTFLLVRLLP